MLQSLFSHKRQEGGRWPTLLPLRCWARQTSTASQLHPPHGCAQQVQDVRLAPAKPPDTARKKIAPTQSPRAKASGTRKSARQMRKRERQWDKRIGVTRGINRSPARITVQPNPRLRPSLPGPAYLHYPPPRRLSPSPSYPHPSYPHPSYPHPFYTHPSYPHPFYTHPSYPHPSPTPISTQVTETTLPEPPFPTGTPSPHRNPPHPPLNLPHPT